MDNKKYIDRAKELLFDVTPMPFDCGRLCGGACCQGDETIGMELLPGEYDQKQMSFGKVIQNTFVCNGTCDRRHRPYACMIFPLFPLVKEQDGKLKIEAVYDIRSRSICPMKIAQINKEFYTAVRRTARILCESEELCSYLIGKTNEIEDIIKLNQLLFDH